MRYLVNPVTRRLIKSRFGPRMEPFGVLSVTGRRTGITREVPCGIYVVDDREVAFTDGAWRFNLSGGAEVAISRKGERRHVRAELVDDPAEVGVVLQAVVSAVGAKKLMLHVRDGAGPDDFAAAGRSLIRFTST
jgi:hypothetical protein